jgi:hypothetical protein
VKEHPQAGFIAHDNRTRSFFNDRGMREWVAIHVSGDTQDSPFISTTLSLFWALVLAHKIQHSDRAQGEPVYISIIKASMLDLQMMHLAYDDIPYTHRQYDVERLRRLADQSQEVLVLHQIPARAILSTFTFNTYDHEEGAYFSYRSLRWTPKLPWLTFNDDDDGYESDYSDYSLTARDYAERWADTFTRMSVAQQRRHGARSLALAIELLGRGNWTYLSEDVKALAIYLYRWPRSSNTSPSWDYCSDLMERRWRAM